MNLQKNYTPLVSIITPSYNAEQFISEAIKSVQNQTYENWELLIVDDCSTDNTCSIIEKHAKSDSRINLIRLSKNMGAAVARNSAIEKARGKYIAFLDSDDKWMEKKIEKQLNFMIENDYWFTFTSYRIMDEDGNLTEKVIKAPKSISYNELLKNTIIGCLSVMIDIEETGKLLMPNIRAGQDTAYWLLILKKGYKAYGLDEELAYYRERAKSLSSNKFKAIKRTWHIYRNVERLSLMKSSYCFTFYLMNAIKKRI